MDRDLVHVMALMIGDISIVLILLWRSPVAPLLRFLDGQARLSQAGGGRACFIPLNPERPNLSKWRSWIIL